MRSDEGHGGRTSRGVEGDFDEFAAAAFTRLSALAGLLGHDAAAADDLVQHALMKTFLAWKRVHTDPLAYARRIMVNRRIDVWRRQRREQPDDLTADPPSPADHAESAAAQDMIVRALKELTLRERQVVVLRYFEDLTGGQIADELNISLGTVKSTLNKALGKLRVSPEIAAHHGPLYSAGTKELL